MSFLPDLPAGPLDKYRSTASFNWKQMKCFVEHGEDIAKHKYSLWNAMSVQPEFLPANGPITLEEQRRRCYLQERAFNKLAKFSKEQLMAEPWKVLANNSALYTYDASLLARQTLNRTVFYSTIMSLGTERHFDYLDQIEDDSIVGCFALTEFGHGSDTKSLKAQARYSVKEKCFVLVTPGVKAIKCWVGLLGKTATHAVMYAQLYDGAGKCHGLHAFVVPVRDPRTLRAYAGVQVGDMGEKAGFNGVDNGFLAFHSYRIPRECLLNRNADVLEDGTYVSSLKANSASSLGSLSAGRVGIATGATDVMSVAVPIAIRYTAIRTQFSMRSDSKTETAVLEYPLMQRRLFPYLCGTVVLGHYTRLFHERFAEMTVARFTGANKENAVEAGREFHALSCVNKSATTWMSMRAIQECREACGGHGYLASSRFGQLRNDFDPSQTYEGDNNVLLLQTINYILDVTQNAGRPSSPQKSVNFFARSAQWLADKFTEKEKTSDPLAVLLNAFTWLSCYLLRTGAGTVKSHIANGCDAHEALNKSFPGHLHSLALVFYYRTVLSEYAQMLQQAPVDLRPVLHRAGVVFAADLLQRNYLSHLYVGGYCAGPDFAGWLENTLEQQCGLLLPDAVSLADALAPPDFVLQSVIGRADGNVYENLWSSIVQTPGTFEPAAWIVQQKSKL